MFKTALMITLLLPPAAFGQDLASILAENARAHGGNANWSKIGSVRYRLDIKEPGFQVNGIYAATRAGRMRIDIEAGGQRVFAEGLGADGAWQWTPADGYSAQDEASAAALRHGIDLPGRFFTLQQAQDRGARIDFLGRTGELGAARWHLRLTLEDGHSRDYFIDVVTGRTVNARDWRAFHPAVDATEVTVETRYFEPEHTDGLLYFRRSENVNADSGEWLGTTRVLSIEHNVEFPPDYFEPGGSSE